MIKSKKVNLKISRPKCFKHEMGRQGINGSRQRKFKPKVEAAKTGWSGFLRTD
jgi:hypothetical protein